MKNNLCNKCGECCKRIPVDFVQRAIYRDGIQNLTPEFESFLLPTEQKENVTFCICKYLVDNLCTNPNKPEICENFPSSPFAFLPDECGYYGEIFIKLEDIKQKVRKHKEEIIHYEALLSTDKSAQKLIDHHNAFINKYRAFGADNW